MSGTHILFDHLCVRPSSDSESNLRAVLLEKCGRPLFWNACSGRPESLGAIW